MGYCHTCYSTAVRGVPVLLLIMSLLVSCSISQTPHDFSMNKTGFRESDPQAYQFLVAGHIYGSHNDDASRPAATLLQNLSAIQQMDLNLIVLLGDSVFDSTPENFQGLEEKFLYQLDIPVYNAIGNHDIRNNGRSIYEERYGPTYYEFRYGPAQMIVLDTELKNCSIVGEQRDMLETTLHEASQDSSIEQIFVFLHKVIFMEQFPELLDSDNPQVKPNNGSIVCEKNYSALLEKNFLPAARVKPVYLIAGDSGAYGGNFSPFFEKHPDAPLYTIATGIGDTPQDSVILVSIDRSDSRFDVMSLTGKTFNPLETYDLAYWKSLAKKSPTE
ncbi:MAG: metallophosphoesterase [Anaerolineales bacterium]|nr:metallophosphoesterase [Anaerolineales bacterium]